MSQADRLRSVVSGSAVAQFNVHFFPFLDFLEVFFLAEVDFLEVLFFVEFLLFFLDLVAAFFLLVDHLVFVDDFFADDFFADDFFFRDFLAAFFLPDPLDARLAEELPLLL